MILNSIIQSYQVVFFFLAGSIGRCFTLDSASCSSDLWITVWCSSICWGHMDCCVSSMVCNTNILIWTFILTFFYALNCGLSLWNGFKIIVILVSDYLSTYLNFMHIGDIKWHYSNMCIKCALSASKAESKFQHLGSGWKIFAYALPWVDHLSPTKDVTCNLVDHLILWWWFWRLKYWRRLQPLQSSIKISSWKYGALAQWVWTMNLCLQRSLILP